MNYAMHMFLFNFSFDSKEKRSAHFFSSRRIVSGREAAKRKEMQKMLFNTTFASSRHRRHSRSERERARRHFSTHTPILVAAERVVVIAKRSAQTLARSALCSSLSPLFRSAFCFRTCRSGIECVPSSVVSRSLCAQRCARHTRISWS